MRWTEKKHTAKGSFNNYFRIIILFELCNIKKLVYSVHNFTPALEQLSFELNLRNDQYDGSSIHRRDCHLVQ